MYPIKFKDLYYEKIWGGDYFKSIRSNVPSGKIGESWDIACHKNGMSIVQNGRDKGLTLEELIKKYGEKLVGKKINKEEFPLLIKIITAQNELSVQVHPNDIYARKVENELGKNEAWYILDAKENASLIMGTKNCEKEKFKTSLKEGNIQKFLNKVKVKKGDFFFVESGMVHGINSGVTILEIQQSSDITYRVYDYKRGRELHVDKALDVINFSLSSKNVKGMTKAYDNYNVTILCKSQFFDVLKYDVISEVIESSDENRFYMFTCIERNGKIISKEGNLEVEYGDSFLIPASLGKYKLYGNFTLLKSYPSLLKE